MLDTPHLYDFIEMTGLFCMGLWFIFNIKANNRTIQMTLERVEKELRDILKKSDRFLAESTRLHADLDHVRDIQRDHKHHLQKTDERIGEMFTHLMRYTPQHSPKDSSRRP